MSLFTTIGDILNSSSWFPLVKWTFWTMLVLLAVGGVYTARYGKGNLFCQGIHGALKFALVYIAATAGYVWLPGFMAGFSQLPFLSVSEEALTLVNPLGLLDRLTTAMPRVIVRLFFLLLFLNSISILDFKPANAMTWGIYHFSMGCFSIMAYAFSSYLIGRFWPGSMSVLHIITAILLMLFFTILLLIRLYFTFVKNGNNHTFQVVFNFMTKHKFGAPITVSVLSFLLVIIYLVVANMTGHARMERDSFNLIAYFLNALMCTGTLFVFSRFYGDK